MSKPSLSIPAQLERLTDRGMSDSRGVLARALLTQGYFRLSGYWRYFQTDPRAGRNAFEHGTDFGDVLDMYLMDADLRNLLLEGLAEVEVALRTIMATLLCAPGGTGTEYLGQGTYSAVLNDDGVDLRARLLRDIEQDIERSKERHVRHHARAGEVPLWVATEALSFGTLSRMYGLLADETTKAAIAKRFGYTDGLYTSMHSNLRSVAVFRNVCAHHGRIWNRVLQTDKPRLFAGAFTESGFRRYSDTPWGVISVLGHFVESIRQDRSFIESTELLIASDPSYRKGLTDPDRTR
ncbi:Abi family protein [Cnuibacter sp. UC19_7]|uniref:Abi family protein n=1 Tax=Cnuibacter sp. UC19_7 TaxID=3350166 RepID=UPI00366F9077